MKLKKYLTFLMPLLLLATLGFAEKKQVAASNVLAPSRLLVAKYQMIQALAADPKSELVEFTTQQESPAKAGKQGEFKNRGKAFISSLILPGAGEKYLGKKTLAKTFLITEITLWAGYVAFKSYGKWIRKDAITFAATHSGALTDGKPPQFLVDIGNYKDIHEYNDAKQRMYQFNKIYSSDDYYWQWDEDKNRQKFENLRIASDRAVNRSVFMLGGIFANHLLSAIDAVWQTHRHNKKLNLTSEKKVSINIQTNFNRGEIALNIQKLF